MSEKDQQASEEAPGEESCPADRSAPRQGHLVARVHTNARRFLSPGQESEVEDIPGTESMTCHRVVKMIAVRPRILMVFVL
ncbi:hypothetical protein HYFRA_00001683 [Hymenoscyphus fraxineus]|uniref:Uncharacterized protein n=1 Tax=Hymenoscyphus fraxineus TaxID=746836 RepID=A0A9N9L755_9HELO|nr:hypothetical protein HYFRA_00001683 [Hymenoscyphus fraxineus]